MKTLTDKPVTRVINTHSGEHFSFAPQSIGSVNLVSLEPPGARSSAGYSGATWYPAGDCNYQAYYTGKNTVVVHTIEGSASGCLSWFRNCSAEVSAHYVVSEAGGVYQCVDENYRAWHAGCANDYCVGIEHEGYAGSGSHPQSLYDASALLTRDICNRWGIGKEHNGCPPGVEGHVDINNCVCGPGHWDPGDGWDWGYYMQQVNGVTPPPPVGNSAAHYDWLSYPTSTNIGSTGSSCGYTFWYTWAHYVGCAARGYYANWDPGFQWNGRGWIHMDFMVPDYNATSGVRFRYKNGAGSDSGQYSEINECDYACWMTPLDGAASNMYDWNGGRINLDEDWTTCQDECGYSPSAVSVIHMYGDRWGYLNRWTVLGPWSSTALGDSHGLDEANMYLYPAVHTGHGDTIAAGLFGGRHPAAYAPGDMNTTYSVNFGEIWNQNPSQDAYALAWVYAPAGAGPKFDIGSDDGERCWVNGTMITDVNVDRGLTRDSDVTGGIGLPAGWSRVLMKVHQGAGGGGWQGTISLRNGGDNRWNEPSVDFQPDVNGGYSVGHEQDSWYPSMNLANFNGAASPTPASQVFTNNTTVTANGTAAGNFIPLWQVMQYQWGYGITGDTNFLPTTNNTATWSHTENNVTGHRRFHFFAVSKSGRTSFQDSGASGGAAWDAAGHGNYCDVYVDNLAPQDPSLTSATAAGTNQVNLAWSVPLDQGVGIGAGASEDLATGGDNHYRAGGVGVDVRRNGGSVYGWGSGTSVSDTSLDSNTQYTYDIAARDNTSESRGAWHNTTSYVGTTSVFTLAEAPADGVNVTAPASGTYVSASWPGFTSSKLGTGAGLVTSFKYKWSTSASDSISEAEGTDWTSGTMSALAGSDGTYYLYMRSYNGAGVGNGSARFGPYTIASDTAAPMSSASPAGGVYVDAKDVTLSANEEATIYYTADGSEPTTGSSVYSTAIPVTADTTLRFFAKDTAGNTESPAKQEIYAILTSDGSIAEAKQATLGAPIKLGDKALYLKSGSIGYIEETNRLSGIRIEGAISADEGQLICLTGTRGLSADGEPCITLAQVTPDRPGTVAPWATNSKAFQYSLLDGLCVTTWGLVKVGSVVGNSYVISTGSSDTDITVITKAAPTVTGGNFVIVTGAVGFGTTRVIYQK